MIKSQRRINKAMLVAGVIPFRSAKYKQLAFFSIKHDDFLAVPESKLAAGWRNYGYMANAKGMGGRWPRGDELFVNMGYKRVSN